MPAKTATPKGTAASPRVGKQVTPRTTHTDPRRSSTTRKSVSPTPRSGTTASPTKAKRKSGASPKGLSPVRSSPSGSRNASRRPTGTSPSRRASTGASTSRRPSAGASPSRRQSVSSQHWSRRNSVDPLQPERCTVDGEPIAQLRKRLSRSSPADEMKSLSMPADQFLSAITAMNSEPELKQVSNSDYPTEDVVPRAAPHQVSALPPAKPVDPERVDELTSMLESIHNDAHIRVSVNDLVAFEYVDPSSHFWRWGLGTVAALPGPRLAQLMLWSSSDMSDIPPTDCPLSPEERENAMKALEEVRQKREDHEIVVEELNKKLHTISATYRAERHEYHQEMEMAERTLREARHEVRSLDEKDWRECRSYVSPPDIVEFILGAVMCVLGEHTYSWNDTLRIMRSRDFIVNITDFDPSSISPANKRTLQRTYLKDKRFTYQNAMNGSRALGALQRWVAAQTATFKASNKLQKFDISHRNQQDEMADVQRRLEGFKKALAQLDDDEDNLMEKLGDRPERVRFAVTPRPTDVAAAQAAASAAAVPDESLHGTRRAWTFTDETLVLLRSSILVNYDTPDSTTVVLDDEQIEQLKQGLQARAAPYVQEKQAEQKQRKLDDELAKLRGDAAEAQSKLEELKAAQNDRDKELAAKEREIQDLKAKLGEPIPDENGEGGEGSNAQHGGDDDGDDDSEHGDEYPGEDPGEYLSEALHHDGGEPADKNQSRALGGASDGGDADGARSPVDDGAEQRGDGGAPGGSPSQAGGADATADKSSADATAPTAEAVKALEDALADKDQEIKDLQDKLKEAEEAAKAAQDALDAAQDGSPEAAARSPQPANEGTDGGKGADRDGVPGADSAHKDSPKAAHPTEHPASGSTAGDGKGYPVEQDGQAYPTEDGKAYPNEGGKDGPGADGKAYPTEDGDQYPTEDGGRYPTERDGKERPGEHSDEAPTAARQDGTRGGPAGKDNVASPGGEGAVAGPGDAGTGPNGTDSAAEPGGVDGVDRDGGAGGAPNALAKDRGAADPEAAKQKALDLQKLIDALEKESKKLRKAKGRAEGAKVYTGKKMAKNAKFVDVMQVEDEADEDDTPDVDDDEAEVAPVQA